MFQKRNQVDQNVYYGSIDSHKKVLTDVSQKVDTMELVSKKEFQDDSDDPSL